MPYSVFNSETRMKCNIKLANAIKEKNWLSDEMIFEFAQSRIVSMGLISSHHVVESFYFNDITLSSKKETLIARLKRTYAKNKNNFIVIINTSLYVGKHWMVGIIKFDTQTVFLCDSYYKTNSAYLEKLAKEEMKLFNHTDFYEIFFSYF